MTVAYRDAAPEDAAALDRIFDVSFCDAFAHLYRPEDLDAFLSSVGLSDWEAQLRDSRYAFRLAEDRGRPVGFLKLGPLKLPVQPTGRPILLDQLYVLKEHHGAGIAQALMTWALEEAARRSAEEMGELFKAIAIHSPDWPPPAGFR